MKQSLAILAYHRVLQERDELRPGDMDVNCFVRHMRVLARFFNVLPLSDAVRKLENGILPRRAVCITFDDGYADNFDVAWPVLRALNLPATIFVASAYLDGGRMWNDTVIEAIRRIPDAVVDLTELGLGEYDLRGDAARLRAIEDIVGCLKYCPPAEREVKTGSLAQHAQSPLPADLMLTSDQVRQLSRSGIEIGGHTRSHPILKSVDTEEAGREILLGKTDLEEITEQPVLTFAYPNGKPGEDYTAEHVQFVRESGFLCAVSTAAGAASRNDDHYQLPRIGPWSESAMRFGVRIGRAHIGRL